MSYLFLGLAVVLEVIGTLLLPITQNFTRLWPTVGLVVAYSLAFYCLTFALKDIPIAIVYASWAGLGVFLVATFSFFFFKQALPWQAILGLVLIVVGVVLVNTFSRA